MSRRIVVSGSLAIPAGVAARANRAGVTRLTRASVHWADSTTAISNVNGSRWASGIGVAGYSSSRIAWMRAAFSARVIGAPYRAAAAGPTGQRFA
jgi:hypothetical protein